MRGTEVGYGTEMDYGGTRMLRTARYRASVWCYALCGTEVVYGGTRNLWGEGESWSEKQQTEGLGSRV
eukprot:2399450-Rhodomonas_salina.1